MTGGVKVNQKWAVEVAQYQSGGRGGGPKATVAGGEEGARGRIDRSTWAGELESVREDLELREKKAWI